jgi:hypothetical protein
MLMSLLLPLYPEAATGICKMILLGGETDFNDDDGGDDAGMIRRRDVQRYI